MPKLRVLQSNARKSNIVEKHASRHWDRRWIVMRKLFAEVKPVIIGGQEWTVEQCVDHSESFPNWTFAGGVKWGNAPIFWNTTIMHAEENTLLEKRYPSGQRERYMTLIRLTHTKTTTGLWMASIHLASGGEEEPNEAELRRRQMTAMTDDVTQWITEHPYPADGKPNLVVCADLNDTLSDRAGVRKIAQDRAGWKPLRTRVPLAKIGGDTFRSFNGWDNTSRLPRDGKWHDEIFTSGVTVEDAAMRRTCTDVWPIVCSDHNFLSADVIISEELLV